MKRLFSLVAIALVLCSIVPLVSSSAKKTSEDFIQGAWRLTGENDGHAWFLEWTFDRGRFNLKGYPPLYQEGKYRVIKKDGDRLTLELYDQKGNFGTDDRTIEVVIDKKKDTLMIDSKGAFKRTKD